MAGAEAAAAAVAGAAAGACAIAGAATRTAANASFLKPPVKVRVNDRVFSARLIVSLSLPFLQSAA